jgi:hypothetical protein
MGEIIRKTAAADDIISDIRVTLTNARARGGDWKTLAEEQLGAAVALIDGIDARLAQAREALDPLLAALDVKDDDADALLGRVSDEIWNEVGRPASDPALATLFPGGIAYYADGDVEGQPDRMDLLAELLDSDVHPRLGAAAAKGHAREIRAGAKTLRAAVEAARAPRARVALLERVRRAIAVTAQVELASLKRLYKNEHFSERDIHSVIPDRPAAARKPAGAPTPPSPPATQAAADPSQPPSGS